MTPSEILVILAEYHDAFFFLMWTLEELMLGPLKNSFPFRISLSSFCCLNSQLMSKNLRTIRAVPALVAGIAFPAVVYAKLCLHWPLRRTYLVDLQLSWCSGVVVGPCAPQQCAYLLPWQMSPFSGTAVLWSRPNAVLGPRCGVPAWTQKHSQTTHTCIW